MAEQAEAGLLQDVLGLEIANGIVERETGWHKTIICDSSSLFFKFLK